MTFDWDAGQDMTDPARVPLDPHGSVIDEIIRLFNPPDDEEFVVTLRRAAEFLEASDCHCRVSRHPTNPIWVCKRCKVLGRQFDERVNRE